MYIITDAGLLLSNSVIHKVMSSLDWCVKNAFSYSDDDNLGRCILHATAISCQESIQVCSMSFSYFMCASLLCICRLQSNNTKLITTIFCFQGYALTSYTLDRTFNMEDDIQRLARDSRFDSALTLYPVQEPNILFQLHAYFCKVSKLNNVIAKNVVGCFVSWNYVGYKTCIMRQHYNRDCTVSELLQAKTNSFNN